MPGVVGEQRGTGAILPKAILATLAAKQRAGRQAGGIREKARCIRTGGQRRIDPCKQHAGQIRLIGTAEAIRLVAMQGFVGVERTDHPVQTLARSGQAQFLAEGPEPGQHLVLARRAVEDVGRTVVEVQAVDGCPVAQCGDRGQHRLAQPRRGPIQLRRHALVLDILRGAAIAVGTPALRIGTRNRALPAWCQRIDQCCGRPTFGGDGDAAVFPAAGVVGSQIDVQVGAGFP
ncbi:hypothetical protein [Xanthomonas arboricola]|uniref:Uncharacterized protein n=1 Tax=Xanthomonas arboricola TaxID=56448 RepID=A0AAU9HVM4_9XANT|nr:hypothetical protein [Xanthomonas arboricola]CAE6755284.1 hypothetical protein XA1314C_17630 [Xanthomonas arboricola]CAE6755304.1 hypothetical protein XA1314C_17630 [Xanthomonas arboricola]